MRRFWILLAVAFPVLDVVVTMEFTRTLGLSVWWWLALAALVGVWLIRREGRSFKVRFMAALTAAASAQDPHPWRSVLDSGRKVLSGVLLLLPGAMSDLMAGLLLMIPLNIAARLIPVWATSRMRGGAYEGNFRRID